METQALTDIDPRRAHVRRTGDRGASLVEYALLVALIAVVCIAAVTYFGTQTDDTFSRVSSSVEST
ncbi:Flp family type IVb pilin [Acidimicrobiia bacterium EGI L10123]|uniref:Flp family type IVb pilin n=1 Tax=Salinilacustrithrix flava TaxID=2957203 RepID=UPI003D7C1FA4|nr:Flp family type IVb pilin [Acidimicrobiia bacterium EGI L10123]